jgi:hypothetical protein
MNSRVIKLYLGAFILVVTGMGSILAANINISTAARGQEFGQGEYRIKACDSWVNLDLIQGATGEQGAPEGFSPLTGISISGLDTQQCANISFTITALDPQAIPLPLYRTDSIPQMCGASDCFDPAVDNFKFTINIGTTGIPSLADANLFHRLIRDAQSGTYQIAVDQPALLAKDVARLNIQSGDIR